MRFAMTLTRSRPDAEDLVRVTCERALSRAAQWSPDTRLESWLFRIMQMVWDNEGRARRVRSRYREAEEQNLAAMVMNPADTPVDRLMLRRVEGELFDMPESDRMVLLLVCVEGLSYKETAEVIGVPVGTVVSRLVRARMALMARLEAPRQNPGDNEQRLSRWCS
jgi:RNA polymerase sigma-70 factor (ECF subfamily)